MKTIWINIKEINCLIINYELRYKGREGERERGREGERERGREGERERGREGERERGRHCFQTLFTVPK
jgi:hypothetical protein